MAHLKYIFIFVLISTSCSYGQQATRELVGGPCEGCEAVFEYGDQALTPVDTLPDFSNPGPKLKVTGTIYEPDGTTPAKGVVLYVYHTNQKGIYEAKQGATGWARRHGYIRGWVKTGADGRYTFYTLRPGHYPNSATPAHIHPIVLEPNGKYYWLGSYWFEDDPRLTEDMSDHETPRGGENGVLKLQREDAMWVGERDIVLGLNVPDYD